jgi:hypothetical protein
MPANSPASRDMRLSTQSPPCSSTTADTNSTNPGRSFPITVTTRDSIGDTLHTRNHPTFQGFSGKDRSDGATVLGSLPENRLDLGQLGT